MLLGLVIAGTGGFMLAAGLDDGEGGALLAAGYLVSGLGAILVQIAVIAVGVSMGMTHHARPKR